MRQPYSLPRRLLLALGVIAAVALPLYYIGERPSAISTLEREAEGEVEENENPAGRADWEWMRLHDPKTGRIPEGIREREQAFAASLPKRDSYLMKSGSGAALQSADWQQRGPYNVGGRTRALAVDAADENVLLAGGASGGMWRSSDGGGSWTRTTLRTQHPTVTCLAQDLRPGKTSTWYYGTGEFHGSTASADQAKYSGDGIFKSTDGGRTWAILPSTLSGSPTLLDNSFEYVWNIATDPSNTTQDELYAAVYGGIKRSTDGGVSWSDVLGRITNTSSFTDVAVTPSGVVYATLSSDGQAGGIYRSADGINWTRITPGGWPGNSNRTVIGLAPSDENLVYFLGETPDGGFKVSGNGGTEWHSFWRYTYISGDGTGNGGIWEDRSRNLPGPEGLLGGFRSQRSYDLVIKVKPDDPDVVFIGGTNLYRSDNGFASNAATRWIGGYLVTFGWLDFSYPNHHPDQHSMAFANSNPRILYSGHDGGVSKTLDCLDDSVTWISLNNGYLTTQLYSVALDRGTPGDRTLLVGMQDNSTWMSRSDDAAAPWKHVGPGDGAFCAIGNGGSDYYVSSQYGRIYRVKLNEGDGVENFVRIDPSSGPAFLFINPLAVDPSDTKVLYHLSGGNLWRNNDVTVFPFDSSTVGKSQNWGRVNTSSMPLLTAVGVSTANPSHRVYCGTRDARVAIFDNAHQTTSAPRFFNTGLPSTGYVSCIAVDPEDGDKAMLILSNYGIPSIYHTTNGGGRWVEAAGNLEQRPDGSGDGPSCRWGAILHVGETTIYYVGTSTGLYSTTVINGRATQWVQEGPSTIGNVVVDMIDVRQSDGMVAVATHGNGVFTATVGTAGAPPAKPEEKRLLLHEASPNPVRSAATLSFSIASAGHVRLGLYDMAGREILRPVDRRLEAGEHTVVLDADATAGLPNGIYFLRAESAGVQQSRSIRIVR